VVTRARSLAPLALLVTVVTVPPARADVFSPGDLSRPHAKLEGLPSCTKCHVAGEQLAADRCLECHVELKDRVAQGRGFHGRIPPAERACQACHHEHQGREFPLVDWGKGGEKGFDHARTGWALEGKHRNVACARCHDPRLAEPAVRALLEKQPGRRTLLGAPRACASCHFDEHRGQLGTDCQRCHGVDGWKPTPRFDHARTAYRLEGRHAKVECARCHKPVEEPARAAAPALTAPVHPASFVRYKPVPFQACTDCHKDPHQSRLGGSCKGCHTVESWKKVAGVGAQKAFHERTRYPLRGAHLEASCESCHGPWPGVPARYKNMAFGTCTDCHADAHVGQLVKVAKVGVTPAVDLGARTCDRCHGMEGFLPARFEAEDHDRSGYKLEGAHRAVACTLCHPKDPRLAARFPAAVKARLERQRRPVKVSLAVYDLPKANDCRTCHRDPHAGQLDARMKAEGCGACHVVESFRKLRLDHQKDTRFPLTGKHEKAACASCHLPDPKGVVQWRPVASACAACHADVHAGQLAVKGHGTDCARCHETGGWKEPLRFTHRKPFTSFALEGKHRKVECAKCHPAVSVGGVAVRRYRPVPTECEGCHADFHKGAFRGYVP
jgi:hypothetical protein